jgi:hypothetical protein
MKNNRKFHIPRNEKLINLILCYSNYCSEIVHDGILHEKKLLKRSDSVDAVNETVVKSTNLIGEQLQKRNIFSLVLLTSYILQKKKSDICNCSLLSFLV